MKVKALVIDSEFQFRFVMTFVILITVESAFVGAAFWNLILIPQDWQRPHLVFDFFWSLVLFLVPLLALNTLFGLYWSALIARPLKRLEKGLKDLREGHLAASVDSVPGDALKDLIASFNETMGTLRHLITRDRQLVLEVVKDLEKGRSMEQKHVKELLLGARSKLSMVNAHFFKEGS
ncbi:MAG: hypothetical protein HY399_02390 [Elusimicrobia bacterium]|nr:hypothetical protein [Elusimicrobiota bacterium]